MGWWCNSCQVSVLTGSIPCPKCGKCENINAQIRYEILFLNNLLKELDPEQELVNYAHFLLCNLHKMVYINFWQPQPEKREDGTEVGASNIETGLKIDLIKFKCQYFETVKEVRKKFKKAILKNLSKLNLSIEEL